VGGERRLELCCGCGVIGGDQGSTARDERVGRGLRGKWRLVGELLGEAGGVDQPAEPDLCLDPQRRHAEGFAHRADPAVDGDACRGQRDGFFEVAAR